MITFRSLSAVYLLAAMSLSLGCTSHSAELSGASDVPGMTGTPHESQDIYGVSGGREDRENLWRDVVRIRSGVGMCSGILIAPRVVLTAAHCFCSVTKAAFDRGSCLKNATVISHFYLYRPEQKGWEPVPEMSPGAVTVHESFTSQHTSKGFVDPDKRIADLAIVELEHELSGIQPTVLLRSKEVSEKDDLTVIGYGPSKDQGRDGGLRRYGTNHVSSKPRDLADKIGREFRFDDSGAHTHEGDSGGPALYIDGGRRCLAGINGGYAENGTQSWFTSTASYYDWITAQIKKVQAPRAP